jgi:hypothetical protein
MAIDIIEEAPRRPRFSQQLSQGLGEALQFGQQIMQQQQQAEATRQENERIRELTGFDIEGVKDPKQRQKLAEMGFKSKLEAAQRQQELEQNRRLLRGTEKLRELPEGSLSEYESDPYLAEKTTRTEKPTRPRLSEEPITPEQMEKIRQARLTPGFDELDEVGQYRVMTGLGVSGPNAEREAKLRTSQLERTSKNVDKSYEAQKDFINETTDRYRAFETEFKPRLKQMLNIPDEDLIGPTSAVFLDKLGIPLGALENPSSELYDKLSHDLLKGLPETYGNRILKVEVDNFLKTIPTLMNSPDGRRMIASNMLKLGEMKEVYYNAMRREQKSLLDADKAFPKDFQQRIFDQVKPQIDRINNEFIKMSAVTNVPKDEAPYFGPDGEIYFVPQTQDWLEWANEKGMKKLW